MNFYNDNDPKACAWLRELIRAGEIPPGDVDERSIVDIQSHELASYTQCHFFAGIGGWAYALQLAGWNPARPCWTGSCPCQPFSCAGKQQGTSDKRHLWPEFYRLIRQCRPPVVFGEQIEGAVGKGWLDGVFGDLEAEAYACGAIVLGAHSVGAPHIRQRLYWLAQSSRQPLQLDPGELPSPQGPESGWAGNGLGECCPSGRLAIPTCERWRERLQRSGQHGQQPQNGEVGRLDDPAGSRCSGEIVPPEGDSRHETRLCVPDIGRPESPWSNTRLLPCTDGKTRRFEPSAFPLAYGVPSRVGLLRGYGNAIVPQVAAKFVMACMNPA